MSIADTLLDIGEAIVTTVVPHGDKLIEIVKKVTGNDDIDPKSITGTQLNEIVKGLDSADMARVHESYNEVIMNESNNYRKMQEAFASSEKTGKSERGKIAKYFSLASIVWITLLMLVVCYVSYTTKTQPDEWVLGVILTFPFTIIGAYVGVKSSEIRQITQLKSGVGIAGKSNPLMGLFSKLSK